MPKIHDFSPTPTETSQLLAQHDLQFTRIGPIFQTSTYPGEFRKCIGVFQGDTLVGIILKRRGDEKVVLYRPTTMPRYSEEEPA